MAVCRWLLFRGDQVSNPMLSRLQEERDEQFKFVDTTLDRAEAEGRVLVDADGKTREGVRQRTSELEEQIKPMAEYEALRRSSASEASRAFGGRGDDGQARAHGQGGNQFRYA